MDTSRVFLMVTLVHFRADQEQEATSAFFIVKQHVLSMYWLCHLHQFHLYFWVSADIHSSLGPLPFHQTLCGPHWRTKGGQGWNRLQGKWINWTWHLSFWNLSTVRQTGARKSSTQKFQLGRVPYVIIPRRGVGCFIFGLCILFADFLKVTDPSTVDSLFIV